MQRTSRLTGHLARWWAAWIVVGGALAIRLVHLYLTTTQNPLAVDLTLDVSIYDCWARAIAFGGEPVASNVMQAPLYPWFMAAVYKIFSPEITAVRLFQALMGTASCAFTIALTNRFFRSRAGAIIAGAIHALYLPLIFYEGVLLPVTLIIFLNMLSITILVSKDGFPGAARMILSGLFLGASIAAKPVAALLLPFIALHLYFTAGAAGTKTAGGAAWKTALRGVLVLLIGVVAAIAPVTVRNARLTGEFIPVSSGLGINFYHGANPEANGYYAVPTYNNFYIGATPEDQARSIMMIASNEAGRRLSQSEVSRFWLRKGIEYNWNHPGRFWRLLATKAFFFWNKHERANVENFNFHRSLPGAIGLPLFTFGIAAPLGLIGIFLTRHRWRSLWLLYGGVITYFTACIVFYVLSRYRLPVVAFLFPLSGAGLVELLSMARRRNLFDLALSVAAFALILYFVNLRAATDTITGESRFWTRVGKAYLEREERDKAVAALQRAVDLNRDNIRAKAMLEMLGEKRVQPKRRARDTKIQGPDPLE
jgi:4-amino-4-deoxy-L-arabinose transferase-like glycosyltransferase